MNKNFYRYIAYMIFNKGGSVSGLYDDVLDVAANTTDKVGVSFTTYLDDDTTSLKWFYAYGGASCSQITYTPDESGVTIGAKYTLTSNTSDHTLTIYDLRISLGGVYAQADTGADDTTTIKTIGSFPVSGVTIEPNGVGIVNFSVRFNYPT